MTDRAAESRPRPQVTHAAGRDEFRMSSERDGDTHTIRLFGELDLATVDAVQHELERVEDSDAPSILVDLSGLAFMDSSGVRLLVGAHARSRTDADRLTLLRGSAAVQRVLEVSGLDDQLPFADPPEPRPRGR
ncbi:MAG: anti-sigma factor antagonist [Solirubrobacteraceae bacterium]|jgi:anti-anti-sigma factor|nr:anti-sigma factor antagonist [Solirubrobacteraceae bacterium]